MLKDTFVTFWYWGATHVMEIALRFFTDWKVFGRENVPQQGALLVVSNHLSNADPPFVATAIPRQMRFMAKEELFTRGFAGWHVRLYGAYRVRRFEADMKALRTTLELLKRGATIGMFPEGTRSRDAKMHPAYPGVGLIALRSGVTVVPVAVWGTEKILRKDALWKFYRVRCSIGEPIRFEAAGRVRTPEAQEATDRIMRAIAALLPPSYRGVYAEDQMISPSPAEQSR